ATIRRGLGSTSILILWLVEVKLVPESKANYKKFQQLKGIWKNRTDIGTDSVTYVNQLRKKIEKREI
ncbi:MAG TPA: hypothetical protein PKL30_26195, partial [Leptospiraceae bacterium]|nr:hypothetical protein [Leptospiraceae bacterium]HNH02967.1 hypothetical protein [Leptospiraceae bacterium]HNN82394.1 hypothetical protein [Leptospiraceae bacterium]